MIDTHTHIYCDAFDDDRQQVIERAITAGVSHVILPGEDWACIDRLHAVQDAYPDYVSLAIGLHPEEVQADAPQQLAALRPLLDTHRYVAVGEIGIDLYWEDTWRDLQMQVLDTQLRWCLACDLPAIIHCRNALDEVLEIIDGLPQSPRGVFHCFEGTRDDIDRIRQRGDFYFGVGGTVTFKKSAVPSLLSTIGLHRILLETDAPYLAPVPHRGERNEPSYISFVCQRIAQELALTPQQVDEVTTANAHNLFRL